MTNMRSRYVSALLIFTVVASLAQSVSVPVRHEVYEFLKKMEALGLLREYRDIIRPISRLQAAEFLLTIERSASSLSDVDLRRLTFFKEEFGDELGLTDPSWTEVPRRWHPLTFELDDGVLNVDLNLAFRYSESQGDWSQKVSNGLRMSGYAFGNFGFSFHFADNKEIGTRLDRSKALSPEDGITLSKWTGSSFEYDFTEAEFSYSMAGSWCRWRRSRCGGRPAAAEVSCCRQSLPPLRSSGSGRLLPTGWTSHTSMPTSIPTSSIRPGRISPIRRR